MKSDSRWRSLLTTLVVAVGLGGVAAAARAGPCEPPLTLDECDLLVGSYTNSVLRYDGATGAFLGEFVAAGSGGLENPTGMVFGPDGNLYVATLAGQRVLRYDGATGDFLDAFTEVVPSGILSIVFGPDGDLYGTTWTGATVFRADGTTGVFIPFADVGLGEAATGLTFGADGDLYVGSYYANAVLRYDGTTGDFIAVFAEVPVPGAPGHVGVTTFGPDGDLYVGILNDIWRFDGTTGDSLGPFLPAADPHPQVPWGLTFGPDGNLYVASNGTDEVLRYDAQGNYLDTFVSAGSGGLDSPTGLVFAPEPGQPLLVATAMGATLLVGLRRRRSS